MPYYMGSHFEMSFNINIRTLLYSQVILVRDFIVFFVFGCFKTEHDLLQQGLCRRGHGYAHSTLAVATRSPTARANLVLSIHLDLRLGPRGGGRGLDLLHKVFRWVSTCHWWEPGGKQWRRACLDDCQWQGLALTLALALPRLSTLTVYLITT